jgi:hypothetical protein
MPTPNFYFLSGSLSTINFPNSGLRSYGAVNYIHAHYNKLLSVAASEAGYDDISGPEDGLISNEDEVADLVDRTRAELGAVIRNVDQTARGSGKLSLFHTWYQISHNYQFNLAIS